MNRFKHAKRVLDKHTHKSIVDPIPAMLEFSKEENATEKLKLQTKSLELSIAEQRIDILSKQILALKIREGGINA